METPKELVEVIWMDACGHYRDDDIDIDELKNNPENFLSETRTYGMLHSHNKKAIVVMHEKSSDDSSEDMEFTTIPKDWVKRINRFKRT